MVILPSASRHVRVMETNRVPKYDPSANETGCCPRFDPEPWRDQALHFEAKAFVKAKTLALFHVPLNMGGVFAKTFEAITNAHADSEEFVVLSRDPTPFTGEHLFAVTRPVPGQQNVTLSGDFLTHVFEGPFADAPKWCKEMEAVVAAKGKRIAELWFYYTTCPKCAKHYGKNYVVGVAKVATAQ